MKKLTKSEIFEKYKIMEAGLLHLKNEMMKIKDLISDNTQTIEEKKKLAEYAKTVTEQADNMQVEADLIKMHLQDMTELNTSFPVEKEGDKCECGREIHDKPEQVRTEPTEKEREMLLSILKHRKAGKK